MGRRDGEGWRGGKTGAYVHRGGPDREWEECRGSAAIQVHGQG